MLFNMEVELFSQIEALDSGKEKQVERARQLVTERLIALSPIFTKTKHMLGDDFTMLDVAIAPLLWRLDHYGIKVGKTAALYMYPYEDHGQATRENILDQWARWVGWLDKYVKNPKK